MVEVLRMKCTMNATGFWNGTLADLGRLSTGAISLPAMFLNNYVCFSNYLLIFYASVTVFILR